MAANATAQNSAIGGAVPEGAIRAASLYGPGSLAAWYLLIASVATTWADPSLNEPRIMWSMWPVEKPTSLTLDLAAVLVYSLLASIHFLSLVCSPDLDAQTVLCLWGFSWAIGERDRQVAAALCSRARVDELAAPLRVLEISTSFVYSGLFLQRSRMTERAYQVMRGAAAYLLVVWLIFALRVGHFALPALDIHSISVAIIVQFGVFSGFVFLIHGFYLPFISTTGAFAARLCTYLSTLFNSSPYITYRRSRDLALRAFRTSSRTIALRLAWTRGTASPGILSPTYRDWEGAVVWVYRFIVRPIETASVGIVLLSLPFLIIWSRYFPKTDISILELDQIGQLLVAGFTLFTRIKGAL